MNALLLIHIPCIIALAWATWRTHKRGSDQDSFIIAVCGSIVIVNAIIRHFVFVGYEPSSSLIIIQQLLSSLIVPFAYMYFAMQVNVKLVNATSILLFAPIALLALPNISIVTATSSSIFRSCDTTLLRELTTTESLNIVTDDYIMQYTIADLVITIQAIVTTIRIVPLFRKLSTYGLRPSNDVKIFTAWWCMAALFVVFASANSDANHSSRSTNIICHIAFMVIMVGIFFLLGRGINFHPVTAGGEWTDAFADKSKDMAQQLMKMIHEKHIHLQNGYSVDTAINELGTNRTYFYRMLHEEFGCTFSELINRERIKEIKLQLPCSEESLSAISSRCGFKNTSYMIKVFKQLEGVTPNEWKKFHNRKKTAQ